MARLDLNGNPLPDDTDPAPRPAAQQAGPRYDLAGNPIADGSPPPPAPSYTPPAPAYRPPDPSPPPHGLQPPLTPGPAAAAGRLPVSPAERDGRNRMILVVGIVGFLVLLVGIVVVRMMHTDPVLAPTGYEKYTLADGMYQVEKPVGWTISDIDKTQGSAALVIEGGVVFTSGSAHIEIAEGTPMDNAAQGAMGIAQIADSMTTNAGDMAFRRYHRLARNHLAGYHEDTNKLYFFSTEDFPYGQSIPYDASRETWGLAGPIKGYYVALSDKFRSVLLVCECQARDWNALKPAFEHVINSVRFANRPIPVQATTPDGTPNAPEGGGYGTDRQPEGGESTESSDNTPSDGGGEP